MLRIKNITTSPTSTIYLSPIHRPSRVYLALLAALFAAVLILPLSAQEADDFSEGFGAGFETEESQNTTSEEGSDNAESDSADTAAGFSSFSQDSGPSPSIQWSGFIEASLRAYPDYNSPESSELTHYPAVGLDLLYTGRNSEAAAELRFSRNWDYDTPTDYQDTAPQNISWYLQHMINQAYLRLFYDRFDLEAGYLKVVWGSGDQSHVVDLLNPTDYYDYVNIDYIDRKLAEFMFKMNVPIGLSGLLQLVYIPSFTPNYSPVEGRWMPSSVTALETLVTTFSANIEQPAVHESLSDGQYAARLSATFGSVDLAATYYYGFLRSPGIEYIPGFPPTTIKLTYNRLHMFGLDFMTVLAGFNLRGEAAYYLTNDFEGEDATRENNHSIQYVGGFDRNLPISNLNLNIQNIGAYFINEDADPTRNILSIALTDSWNNDRIHPEVSFSYGIEKEDFMLRSEISFSLVDDVELIFEYVVFDGAADGNFGQFGGNDYFQLSYLYSF